MGWEVALGMRCCLGSIAQVVVALDVSYVVEISIAEESSTACYHRPQALPFSFVYVCNVASAFSVVVARVP